VRGRPRPHAATRIVDRLKLHRRRLRLDGREYTIVGLRPGMDARFSTNHFHGTWHVLSDWRGARLLGRLLWGLAYQRIPGTLVLIDRMFLDPNPFDGEPADPIVLVPVRITALTAQAGRALRRRLPLEETADGTVRWHTPGLDAAVAAWRAKSDRSARPCLWSSAPSGTAGARAGRVGGLMTIAGDPDALREAAVSVHTLGDHAHEGMDYTAIDWPNGEVQVFRDYRQRVSAARVARQEVLAGLTAVPHPDDLRPLIWHRSTEVRRRQRVAPGPHS